MGQRRHLPILLQFGNVKIDPPPFVCVMYSKLAHFSIVRNWKGDILPLCCALVERGVGRMFGVRSGFGWGAACLFQALTQKTPCRSLLILKFVNGVLTQRWDIQQGVIGQRPNHLLFSVHPLPSCVSFWASCLGLKACQGVRRWGRWKDP
ncbi:hypothetical protein PCH_Pc20g12220 [Penicillium rubens Wisconsin 54-1255]|uniref:Uncharacterized protein n=1 Tax=Penicillium rubens (strain ATCC 28089 / DSM 1075 / NRRL 1951 / Wisconsin 54-1255) TaxID=500485 RepID=B6HGI3_PENRW|nr:hypothetical protein PCH_Pc20g12220 [Penicillium rubens Wisconsin 54-1255]